MPWSHQVWPLPAFASGTNRPRPGKAAPIAGYRLPEGPHYGSDETCNPTGKPSKSCFLPSSDKPQLAPATERVGRDSPPRRASRVLACSLLTCCHPAPRRSGPNLSSNCSVRPCQPSPRPRRVGLRIVSFGAVSVFTRVTACQLADGLTPPSVSQASATSLPP